MNDGALPARTIIGGGGVPLIPPLVTGLLPPISRDSVKSVRIPPLRIGAAEHVAVAASSGASLRETMGTPGGEALDWRDETTDWQIGEAEPEDELPLHHTNRIVPAISSDFGERLPVSPAAWPAPARVEEIAEQLEGIARALRRHGSPTPLLGSGQGRDPLTALVAGYLIGYFEGSGKREPGTSG